MGLSAPSSSSTPQLRRQRAPFKLLLPLLLLLLLAALASSNGLTFPPSATSTLLQPTACTKDKTPRARARASHGSTWLGQRVRGGAASPKAAAIPAAKPLAATATATAHADGHHGLSIHALAINIMADLCPHGMLPLAFGMASEGGTGLVPALALLSLFGTLSAYTLVSVARACEATGQASFRGIWSKTLGARTAWIIDAGITFLCFGCCIFYAAFIGDLTAALAQALGAPALLHKRWVCLVAVHLFPLLPLCLMKNMAALQYSSVVGVLGIIYTTAFVVKRQVDGTYSKGGQFHDLIESVYKPNLASHSTLQKLFRVGPGAVSLMNMACVAFTTHYNGISYYTELQDRSLPRYTAAVGLGFVASFSVFALMMAFGYGTFGYAAQPLLLNNYHKTADALATGSRLATAFSIVCGFPLMFAGLKTGFFSLWRSNVEESARLGPKAKKALVSEPATTALSTLLLAGICAIACQCTEEEVGFVIGVIGAILGTGVVYIIPALLNSKLLDRVKDVKAALPEKRFNLAIIAMGTVFGVLGTYAALEEHFPGIISGLWSGKAPVAKVKLH